MSRWILVFLFAVSTAGWAQNSSASSNSAPADSRKQDSTAPGDAKATKAPLPDLAPPRSDRVNAADLGDEPGQSSSKDSQIDLSPPSDDTKSHPQSSQILKDEGTTSNSADVAEFHPWDPHKAAKDVEVGDFYFKRKNYVAAESRYREALYYKDNDALATFRLAVCLEKMDRPDEALQQYEGYLKILPHGLQAEDARKAIEHLKSLSAKPAK